MSGLFSHPKPVSSGLSVLSDGTWLNLARAALSAATRDTSDGDSLDSKAYIHNPCAKIVFIFVLWCMSRQLFFSENFRFVRHPTGVCTVVCRWNAKWWSCVRIYFVCFFSEFYCKICGLFWKIFGRGFKFSNLAKVKIARFFQRENRNFCNGLLYRYL